MKVKIKLPKNWKRPTEIMQRETRRRAHFRLPAELLNWLQLEAHDAGVTGTQLVEQTLADYRTWVENTRTQKRL